MAGSGSDPALSRTALLARTPRRLAASAALLALAAPPGPAAAQEAVRAGVAGAVVSPVEVSGPPRAEPVEAATGMDMFLDDRIRTGEAARLQVMLLDETVFTVGPGSDLVIDRFVYDPDQGTGELAGEMASGFLRYVSGQVGENSPENVTIDTPAGTIGVRGTALVIAEVPERADTFFCGVLGPGRDNNALARPGACLVSNDEGTAEVRRAGYGVYLTRGEPPGEPVAIPEGILARMHTLLRPATVARAGDAALPAGVARAAGADPVEVSLQGVAQQRELASQQIALLETDFDILTESGSTDEIDQRPPDALLPEMPGTDPVATLPFFAQLTWSNVPDLDLHATGPNPNGIGRFHVFFATPRGPDGPDGRPLVELGAVDSSLERSEVLSFNGLSEGGVTRVSVFNFSDQTEGSTSLAREADATVSLLRNGLIERGPGGSVVIEGDLIDQVRPPEDGAGNTFVAYEIAPDGTATPVRRFTDFPNAVAVE